MGWGSDNLMLFSVLDASIFVGIGSQSDKYQYPAANIGTYIYDTKNKTLKKIFNYVIDEGGISFNAIFR